MKDLKKNYHTHTYRCGHAKGADRDYVENAVRAGFELLGFSDHAPMPFPDGHESPFRMKLAETAGYFESVARLREEYAGQIRILAGLEVEYYPAHFQRFLDFIGQFPVDYLILGQHFVWEEREGNGVFAETKDPGLLKGCYDCMLEGAATGSFLYIAHPDVLRYTGDETAYETLTRDFLTEVKKLGVPLELNRLGMADGRIYPREKFWQLAGDYGVPAYVGMDAHDPAALLDEKNVDRCLRLARSCGVRVLD